MSTATLARTESQQTRTARGEQLVDYIAGASRRNYPAEVTEAALKALVDHLGCAVGAWNDATALPARAVVALESFRQCARLHGRADDACPGRVRERLDGPRNGLRRHARRRGRPSGGPCWSAALALAQEHGASEKDTLAAFITGFDVMAKLGGGGVPGVGRSLQRRGWHPTSIFGRVGAAAVGCVIMKLEERQICECTRCRSDRGGRARGLVRHAWQTV
ncbi:MAG: MmgE/PrpD family protein [Burkholderiales bacterium]